MTKELVPAAEAGKALQRVKFDDVVITVNDVRDYLCPKATPKEIFMAMGIMASYKLNPFKREVHLIKYGETPAQVVVGYETYLKRAERTGKLNGWKAWIDKEKKQACVVIHRKDWNQPFEWYVELAEFDKKQSTWKQIPDFMGKKVAIAQAFRIAFPDELGGLPYTAEEHEVYDTTGTDEPAGKPALEGEVKPLNQPAAATAPEKATEQAPASQEQAPEQSEVEEPPLDSELDGMDSITYLQTVDWRKTEKEGAVWAKVIKITDKMYNDKKYAEYQVFEPGTEAATRITSFSVPAGIKTGDILVFENLKPGKKTNSYVAETVRRAA